MDFPKREDWLEILGVTSAFESIYSGQVGPNIARVMLEVKREEILNVPYDHIAAINVFNNELDQIDEMITEQNDALSSAASSLSDIGLNFNWDSDKLLSEIKVEEFEDLQEEAQTIAEEAEGEAIYWEGIIEEQEETEEDEW